jgi:divalent metal cation (Fe/Co/Zn/Cd) transporter
VAILIFAMAGILAAFAGIYLTKATGNTVYDGISSIIIGCVLGGTAIWLAYETKSLLIGESAGKTVRRGIRDLALSVPEVEHVNELLTLHMGPDFILVNISVKFTEQARAEDIESAIAGLDKNIKQTFPQVKRVFVEAEAKPPGSARGIGFGLACFSFLSFLSFQDIAKHFLGFAVRRVKQRF